jgi:predicted unusual protein kinase regulating ubiquinone biosynthesis (AarF/ABC1/UbiB family)
VPALTEEQVVAVMEQELGVPWEDVFETIDPLPLAAGTIAEVHRAMLATGERVVVKVQRPEAKELIEQDLALLEVFAEKVGQRQGLKAVIDMEAVFNHLSDSLHRELDFREEASNMERMRTVIASFPRLAVPTLIGELSTSRLLVMQDVQGGPLSIAPEGPARHEAARQLLESFYKQIMVDGFFHADPHPGNLMWQPISAPNASTSRSLRSIAPASISDTSVRKPVSSCQKAISSSIMLSRSSGPTSPTMPKSRK